jgi:hypothetical protein
MRSLTTVLIVILIASCSVQAQESMLAPNMVPTSTQDIAVKLDKTTGKIELVNTLQNVAVTQFFKLNHLELEIFDSRGEYAGSLELKDFLIPKNEVDKSEKVKITKISFKNASTGQELTLSNVDFLN